MLQKALHEPKNTKNNNNKNKNYSNLPLPSRALQPVDTNIGGLDNVSNGMVSNRSSNTQPINT